MDGVDVVVGRWKPLLPSFGGLDDVRRRMVVHDDEIMRPDERGELARDRESNTRTRGGRNSRKGESRGRGREKTPVLSHGNTHTSRVRRDRREGRRQKGEEGRGRETIDREEGRR